MAQHWVRLRKQNGRKYRELPGRKLIVILCSASQILNPTEWTDERHGFKVQTIKMVRGIRKSIYLNSTCIFIPGSLKTQWERCSYLEEKEKTKKGIDTTSCRVRHSRKTKASPPSITCPILKVQDISVNITAFDRDLVHSITGRKSKWDINVT